MRVRLLAFTAIVALAAAACGSDDAATTAEPASTGTDAAADAPAGASGDVPALDMIDVYTGDTVNLQSLVSSQTPLLLWFWAPH